jgi:hypothetical protein
MTRNAFVLMPLAPEYDEIYNLFIAPTLVQAGFDVRRADDILSQSNILQDILLSILAADIIVADLTSANPNVYYELGLAHAMGKPVIVLTQSVEALPFDLRSYRVVPYNTHFSAIEQARQQLLELAKGALAGRVAFGSPVADFLPADVLHKPPIARAAPKAFGSQQGEPGFLDHLVAVEEGFSIMTTIIQRIGVSTRANSGEMETATSQILEASASPRPNLAKHLQHLIASLGDKQSAYADALEAANDEFVIALAQTGDSIEHVVTFQPPSSDTGKENLQHFIASLAGLEDSSLESRASFQRLADTMDAMPRMERTLNRGTERASQQVRRFVDYTDQVISMASRARAIAGRLLSSAK